MKKYTSIVLSTVFLFVLAACSAAPTTASSSIQLPNEPAYVSSIAGLEAANLDGRRLRVVATTNLVGDLLSQVGGEAIELTTLLPTNADPHSYTPTPQDLRAVAEADVIMVSGFGLEEGLGETLDSVGGDVPIISLSEGIRPRAFSFEIAHDEAHDADHADDLHDEHDEAHDADHADDHHDEHDEAHEAEDHQHAHEGVDPHVWFDPANIERWGANAAAALSQLDPDQAEVFEANHAAYSRELDALDAWITEQVNRVPADARRLVTDHGAFGYFADRYGFDVIGAVIPAYSTTASSSPQDLTMLLEAIETYDVQAVFVGVSVNPTMAERVAEDSGVALIPLYTGSLSDPSGPASTYLALMRYNVSAIVNGLWGEG